jgi:GT2 family glycosyltransferase/glycosyltransferase involved in cell wall biosynthesis
VVLFASYSGSLGGAERLLIDWAKGLESERLLACPEGALANAARASGLRVLPLRARSLELRSGPLLASVRLAGYARELRRLVADLEPDLVVAWGMRPAIALLLGPSLPIPVVFHHNDLLPGRWIGRAVRTAARRAALVTAPSHAVASELGTSVEVVHPGVEVDRFLDRGSPRHPPEVLVLGALVPWKRPELAIEAFALARRRHPELRLRLVGAAVDGAVDRVSEGIVARCAEAGLDGAVELAGPSDDPAAELARATCLLHCAEREPFGIAVLESLAAARPAIVPAAAGPAEIADSSCALLYPPGDAAAAAEAICTVVADRQLAERLGAAGRERARTEFDGPQARARWARAVSSVRRPRQPRATVSLEIVTVTHNSAAVLPGLLESVATFLPGVRVIVVDCASSDDSVAVAHRSRLTRVIALEQNLGFGRACNVGVGALQAPVSALLNPDVELIDDSLLALAAHAAGAPRLLAPLVLCTDGTRQDTVHPAPGSAADLIRSVLSPSVVPLAPLAPWLASSARPVGWAVGCALVGQTELLQRLGPFDESIFLYGEDLELGLRAAREGIETWFWPAARLIHHRAHSSAVAFGEEPFERLARARRDVVLRRLGPGRQLLDDCAQSLTFASRTAVKRALGRPAARERRQLAALRAARRSHR